MLMKRILCGWMLSLLVFENFVYSIIEEKERLLQTQDSTNLYQPIKNLVANKYLNVYSNAHEQRNKIEYFFILIDNEFKIHIFYSFEEEVKNKSLDEKLTYIYHMIKKDETEKRDKTVLLLLIKTINESNIIKPLVQSQKLQCENFTLSLKEDQGKNEIDILFKKNGFITIFTEKIKNCFNSTSRHSINSSKKNE